MGRREEAPGVLSTFPSAPSPIDRLKESTKITADTVTVTVSKMAVPGGAIIENMSSRKLTYLVVVLLVLFLASFFLGAIVSPKPNGSTQITATKCVDLEGNTHR